MEGQGCFFSTYNLKFHVCRKTIQHLRKVPESKHETVKLGLTRSSTENLVGRLNVQYKSNFSMWRRIWGLTVGLLNTVGFVHFLQNPLLK